MQKGKQKSQQTLTQLHHVKRYRTPFYPYFPITDSYRSKGYGFLFGLDISATQNLMAIHPLKGDNLFDSSVINLKDIPNKNMTSLKIIEFKWNLKPEKQIIIESVDFLIGFLTGNLVRCSFNGKICEILQKYNKKPNPKEGLMTRMSNMIFGSEQWYNVAHQKPVFSIKMHEQKALKYKFSYQIGDRIFLTSLLSSESQLQCNRIYTELNWQSIRIPSIFKHTGLKSVSIKGKDLKALIRQKQMLIEFLQDTPKSYIYHERGLFITNNFQNKIILYNCESMERMLVYKIDCDIKRITLSSFQGNDFLTVMPYQNFVLVINLNRNDLCCFIGNKCYVVSAVLTGKGNLVTAGGDHRVGIKNINKVKEWRQIQPYKLKQDPEKMSSIRKQIQLEKRETLYFQINTNLIEKEKMAENYFFGEFNNINRNNNVEYGFGDMIHVTEELFAFLTFDYFMKIYKICV